MHNTYSTENKAAGQQVPAAVSTSKPFVSKFESIIEALKPTCFDADYSRLIYEINQFSFKYITYRSFSIIKIKTPGGKQ